MIAADTCGKTHLAVGKKISQAEAGSFAELEMTG
jgi:hypothetical protein